MYSTWLFPTERILSQCAPHTVGAHLSTDLSHQTRLAIIGLDVGFADRVRRDLDELAWDFGSLKLADLGNLRKTTVDFAIPLLKDLQAAGITPILLGCESDVVRAQYLAYRETNRRIGIFCLDQHIDLDLDAQTEKKRPSLLGAALLRSANPYFHLAHAGAQQHLLDARIEPYCRQNHHEVYRLGQVRQDLSDMEPPIRDADLMMVNLAVTQWTEAPAQSGYHPSGLSLQELSQLCYYGGNSDRLSSFSLYGFHPEDRGEAECRRTAAGSAQLLWYFLYGYSRRFGDFPIQSTGLTEYLVSTTSTGRVTFWRSPRSKRWWVQVPALGRNGEGKDRLVACSERDYQQTSQESKLPDRILSAFARF